MADASESPRSPALDVQGMHDGVLLDEGNLGRRADVLEHRRAKLAVEAAHLADAVVADMAGETVGGRGEVRQMNVLESGDEVRVRAMVDMRVEHDLRASEPPAR